MDIKVLIDKKNWEKLFFVYRHNKRNTLLESQFGGGKIKIYGFYHAYCMCEKWEELVEEQLEHIVSSGLYDNIDYLFVGVLISQDDVEKLNKIISRYSKVQILYTSNDGSLFEFKTLMEMQKKSYAEEFIGFYFHTKGITWLNADPKIYAVCNSWRLMNEYFLFDKWKLATVALQQGYDLYGTNYQKIYNDKYRLLGMNFFWFKSSYVAKLSPLYVAKDCRNLSEVWICSKSHNVYCPFEFSGNSRNTIIAHEFYDQGFSLKKACLTVKVYFARFSFWLNYLTGHNNLANKKVNNQRGLSDKDFEYLKLRHEDRTS